MYIKESNIEKIKKEIDKAEGRASARTILAEDMIKACNYVEKKLGINKVDLVGVEINVDLNAQNFPRAYKYTPESTHFSAIYKKSGWYLMSVYRGWTRTRGNTYWVTLTEKAQAAVIKRNSFFD